MSRYIDFFIQYLKLYHYVTQNLDFFNVFLFHFPPYLCMYNSGPNQ